LKSTGKADAFIKDNMLHVKILKPFHENFYDIVTYWKKNQDKEIDFDISLSVLGRLVSFESGGVLRFEMKETPVFSMDKVKNFHIKNQQKTLRGIERFIGWAQLGYRPKEEDMYWIHEEILHHASRWELNPISDMKEPIRTTDPRMDTKTMSGLIQYALDMLAMQDIPNEVMTHIGDDMMALWDSWYKWRYSMGEEDPLFEREQDCSWEEYCEFHPVCELCGKPGTDSDALERAHIITVGSRLDLFDKSWNWLRIHHSHHHMMHADRDGSFVGWDAIIKAFPFIAGKIERAKKLAEEVT
jgi:hypothetical protein